MDAGLAEGSKGKLTKGIGLCTCLLSLSKNQLLV